MLMGGKMGNCVPPPAPLPYVYPRSAQASCSSPGTPCGPAHVPHSRLQLTLLLAHHCYHSHQRAADMRQAGHSQVALGGDAAPGVPKAVHGWVDWHRDEGKAAQWLALRAGWILWGP